MSLRSSRPRAPARAARPGVARWPRPSSPQSSSSIGRITRRLLRRRARPLSFRGSAPCPASPLAVSRFHLSSSRPARVLRLTGTFLRASEVLIAFS